MAENPDRKALKGCLHRHQYISRHVLVVMIVRERERERERAGESGREREREGERETETRDKKTEGKGGQGFETYVVASNDTIDELQDANNEQKGHEDVNNLDSLGSLFHVAVPDAEENVLCVRGIA